MSTETRIEAGRELDALVAVEVMGWTLNRKGYWYHPQGVVGRDAPPEWSTSGACLEVLERMREQGWIIELTWVEDGEPWFAAFTRFEGYFQDCASTLPHAICLAAYEAVRAEAPTPAPTGTAPRP